MRLVDSDGKQVGVVSIDTALEEAKRSGLDLVEISPNVEPPVCRIMDFGKHQFEQNKQRTASRKKQKKMQVKEIKFRPTTEAGDYEVKLRNVRRFLEDGDKVKITVRFRGRELVHQELGILLLRRVEADLKEVATVEQFPKLEGRQMVMVIGPVKK